MYDGNHRIPAGGDGAAPVAETTWNSQRVEEEPAGMPRRGTGDTVHKQKPAAGCMVMPGDRHVPPAGGKPH
ncbi:hypothetical protein CN311_22395 [Mesorhizobium sanjuanii]|uniref:Uncharacterized protein n=1 Tax=Mesorhizobium sanjuanii TaxID=2037900 RepID=A0A2A6FAM7_9HYPH|nr:hypothetical protein CN311_22395 [Mesorhizobium sanjuanii]